ncbi:NAD(P)H-dependent oxidoreductase [Oceaniglobus ichthyenteri]|uniref:NAD(P)H-dependent oxidoreductase n=1 Tax=Oceaniglobus ichthyenteri TaxID=2136177 RepID=UPI000D377A42|nr:NAD(P)H-dependent oxidoreductase [Oceaniglobus ichthyenteri]
MRALVVYCHPKPDSFTAAVRDVVLDQLKEAGAEIRLSDLYSRGFPPALTDEELTLYLDETRNSAPVQQDVDDLKWCDTLIFVYPTWWYGLPAVLKGWLDRAMVPGVAFKMPDEVHKTIRPGLQHITRLGVFTTCGASWWLTQLVGAPGKRTLMRGLRLNCAITCKTAFAAHYLMDSATPDSLAAHLLKVRTKMIRLVGKAKPERAKA